MGSREIFGSISSTLDENSEYLKALDILFQDSSETGIKVHNSPVKASILSEALSLLVDKDLKFNELRTIKSL